MIDKALVELKKAIKFEGEDSIIFDHLGDAYFKKDQIQKARDAWKKSLELKPDQPKVKEKLKKAKK